MDYTQLSSGTPAIGNAQFVHLQLSYDFKVLTEIIPAGKLLRKVTAELLFKHNSNINVDISSQFL